MVERSQSNLKRAPFWATDIATINAGATYSTPSDALPVTGLDFCSIELGFTSPAGGAGTVTFNLAMSTDGTTFSTETYALSGTIVASTSVRTLPFWVDLRQGIRALKMLSVVNGDSGKAITNVNAYLSASQ